MTFCHEIRIAIVIDHHLKLVRSHDGIEAEFCMCRVPLPARKQEFCHLRRHFKSVIAHERLVFRHVFVVPDAINDARARLKLQARVLPQVAPFRSVQGGDGITRPFAIEHFCPLLRLGEFGIAI